MATSPELPQGSVQDSEISHEIDEHKSVDLPESIQHPHSSSDVLLAFSISSLPNEILLKIFFFLDAESLLECSKVSRLWERLALDPYVWGHVDISVNVSPKTLEAIPNYCGSSLRRLRVDWDIMKEHVLHRLIRGSSNLEILHITNDYVSDHTLRVMAYSCKKLKRLNIDTADRVRCEGIEALCQNCNFLEDLCLKGALFLDKDIEAIASGCPRLKCFGGDTMLYFSPHSLSVLARSCRGLRRVFLENCYLLTDQHIRELVSNCLNLTHLYISACSNLKNVSLHALSKYCPGLEDLKFQECNRLTNYGFATLARHCSHLKKLNLGRNLLLRDRTVSVFLDHCPSLAILDLSFCKQLTDASLIRLGTSPKITHLRLCGNKRFTDAGISHLSGMKQLRVLSLKRCSRLSEACVYQFAHHCPKLEVLEIDERLRYSSVVIDVLGKAKPMLKYSME